MVLTTNLITFWRNWSFFGGLGSRIHDRAQEIKCQHSSKTICGQLVIIPKGPFLGSDTS